MTEPESRLHPLTRLAAGVLCALMVPTGLLFGVAAAAEAHGGELWAPALGCVVLGPAFLYAAAAGRSPRWLEAIGLPWWARWLNRRRDRAVAARDPQPPAA